MINSFRICPRNKACSGVLLATAILRGGHCAASLAPSAESPGLLTPPANDGFRRQDIWTQQTRYRMRQAPRPMVEHFTGEDCTEMESSEDGCDGYASGPHYHPSIEQQHRDVDEQDSEDLCPTGSEYDSEEPAYDYNTQTHSAGLLAESSRAQHLTSLGRSIYPATRPKDNYNCNYEPHTNRKRRTVDYSSPVLPANAVGRLARVAAAAAVLIAAIAPLISALSSHWPYFVAGGICAAVSHTVAVPLDVLKTRIQCSEPGEYKGTWDALVRIWRSEGGHVLFCGAGATLVGYAMQGFFKFGFFEFLKPVFSDLFVGGAAAAAAAHASTPVLSALIAASVAAEVVGSSALTPLEAARIRMVADADYAPGLRSGMARMISEEGVGSLTRGLPAVLAKQVPYTVTKLVTFDVLVRAARGGGRGGGGVGITILCALAAGMLSSLASQPGDSLLSALNSEGGGGDAREGGVAREPVAWAMVRIARDAGFFGLFRGTPARMMHVTSIVTVQLLIYQSVKSAVGIES